MTLAMPKELLSIADKTFNLNFQKERIYACTNTMFFVIGVNKYVTKSICCE